MKHFLFVMNLLFCTYAFSQVDKVDHFYIISPNAEKLFHLFKSDFLLPVNWEYQSWGKFTSGGLTLGNVTLEFVKSGNEIQTRFVGIGLQPKNSAEKAIARLDAAKVAHGFIQPTVFTLDDGRKDTAWETVRIKDILPNEVFLFYCDYKHRNEVLKEKDKAADSLSVLQGGPLGIIRVKDLVIGCKEISLYSKELSKLPGIKKVRNNRFTFESGPSIQLTKSEDTGFQQIKIIVNSLDNAKNYLESKGMLGNMTKNSVSIDPKAIDGIHIDLVSKAHNK